ncbi:PDZ domain-containing protein [Stieleria varia]|uniref:Putative serine protease HhoA n=1 Tax=Stieleria varia TaxID=2528005 RepID=A0A5C6B086_9BACT|nr:PDZ domain-containing protein [Stieleria varia]TWU04696.1 putative serine protease HhoA precursor [Stieleria varia]
MKTRRWIAIITVSLLMPLLLPESGHGQGLFRRLRDRLAPQILPPRATPLPPRVPLRTTPAAPRTTTPATGTPPLTRTAPSTAANTATPSTRSSRSLSTALPRASQINPTPGSPASPVAQASASSPAPNPSAPNTLVPTKPLEMSNLGGSILQPFDDTDGSSTDETLRPTIGIQAVEANPGYPGIQVVEIKEYSRADEAGLQKGDYIFAIDQVATPSLASVVEVLGKYQPGDTVRLRIGRDGEVADLDVPLVASPALATLAKPPVASPDSGTQSDPLSPRIGADVRNIPGVRGVAVTDVQPGSPAQQAGMQVDDRIIAIDGQMIQDTAALAEILTTQQPGDSVELQFVRSGQLLSSTVQLVSLAQLQQKTLDAPSDETQGAAAAGETSETAHADDHESAQPSSSKGGLLSGVGSVLGGMFGKNGNTPKPAAPDAAASPAESPSESDPLALPADDTMRAPEIVDAFETLPIPVPEAIEPAAPASQDGLPETASKDDLEKQAEVERLRQELEDLKSKLKELESDKD